MCLQYEGTIANFVCEKINSDDGVHIPEKRRKSDLMYFHLDNIDLSVDMADESGTTHFFQVGSGNRRSIKLKTPVQIESVALLKRSFGDLLPCKEHAEQHFQ